MLFPIKEPPEEECAYYPPHKMIPGIQIF